MSNMSVELLDSMGDDLTVANVARVSFNKWKGEFDKSDVRLIDYLARHEHTSPFRHTALQLRCKVPVFLARQLGKHQAGLSWNEVSRRYVDVGIEFFVPDSWRSRPADGIKQGSGEEHYASTEYMAQYHEVCAQLRHVYANMVEGGVAPEQARMLLPQSMMVDFIWTGNLFSFFHIWRLRSGEGSQVEAKEFAQLLDDIVTPLFPHCWKALKES